MKKCLIMVIVLILCGISTVHASNAFQIKRNDQVTQDWEIHINYPVFDQLENKELEDFINEKIELKVERQVEHVKEKSREILGVPILYYEEFDVMRKDDTYSVVMFSNVSRGEHYQTYVTSINFRDTEKGEVLTLNKLVDMERLNQYVKKLMAQQPKVYSKDSWTGVREDTAFYIKGEQIVLIFNKYEASPGVYGTPEISVPLDQVQKKEKRANVPLPDIL